MRNITDLINEASINAKKRNINIAKSLYMKGKTFSNIKCFAILTAQNPNSVETSYAINKKLNKELKNDLKAAHIIFIPIQGHYSGNIENSYLLFNVCIDEIKNLAGKYEQTSFFYSYPSEDGDLISEYWEKTNINEPYNKNKNDYKFINKTTSWKNEKSAKDNYTIIGNDFKYTINPEVFEPIDKKISENLNKINEDHNIILEWICNRIGQKANYYKEIINKI